MSMRGGFSRYKMYIGLGPGKPRRYQWIFTSKTLRHYLIMFVTTLYIQYLLSPHWTFCCTGNEAFIKVYQWFYWTSNPKFWKKSQPIPGAAKQSCSTLHHFTWRPSMWAFLLTSLNDGQTTSIIMSHSIYKVPGRFAPNPVRPLSRFAPIPVRPHLLIVL